MSENVGFSTPSAVSLQKGQQLTVRMDDLNNLGCGVGRAPDGRALFVTGAVAGDLVSVEIIKVNRSFAVGRLLSVITPSPHREEGFCHAPLSCGGCVYRHLSYEREQALKRAYIVHCFKKAGLADAVIEPVRTTGETRGYRNKAEYPITGSKNGLVGGFYAQKTHRVVPAAQCALQPAVFGEILHTVCGFMTENGVLPYDEETGKGLFRHLYLREGRGSGKLMVCLVLNGSSFPAQEALVALLRTKFPMISSILINTNTKNTNLVLSHDFRTLWGEPYLEDVLCGRTFRIAPDAFYQVNHDAAELLYGIAKKLATDGGGRGTLLDLYCGAGTIGLSMADTFERIVGIEIVPAAVASANVNKALNGIENAAFYCGDAANAERLLAAAEEENGPLHPDAVILDPPRKGCDAALLRYLAARRIPRIVYVSCGPDTLARDAALLTSLGYTMGSVTPVDLFPRTGHCEAITTFVR